MFCVNCGKQIVDDAKFCSFCGTPVRNVVVQTPSPAPAAEQPVQDIPVAENPVTEQPVQDIPAAEARLLEQPFKDISAAEATVSEQPVQDIPTTEARLLEQPFKDISADEAPVSEQPVQDIPDAEARLLEQPFKDISADEAPISELPEQDIPAHENPIYGNIISEPSVPSAPQNFAENPVPGIIPTSGISQQPQNVGGIIPEAAKNPPVERPERKYTLGHIMICLAAVAVMAITAGVFAGLYFSVV